jgi:hypothetical protein
MAQQAKESPTALTRWNRFRGEVVIKVTVESNDVNLLSSSARLSEPDRPTDSLEPPQSSDIAEILVDGFAAAEPMFVIINRDAAARDNLLVELGQNELHGVVPVAIDMEQRDRADAFLGCGNGVVEPALHHVNPRRV